MTVTVKEALNKFVEMNEGLQEAVLELKAAAKGQGSQRIKEYIDEDKFELANQIISELNEFSKIEFKSNAAETYTYAEKLLKSEIAAQEKKTSFSGTEELKTPTQDKVSNVTVIKETDKLEAPEVELIKTLGYTSVSRFKDSKNMVDETTFETMVKKGYVTSEVVEMNGEVVNIFELSDKGVREFEKTFNERPAESHKSLLTKRFGDATKGFFLYDIEKALSEREFKINEIGLQQIEVTKDNRHSHLTPDMGTFDEAEYLKILDRKNQLKNIGFICINDEVKKAAEKATRKWVESNQDKCKFLTVNFTTVDKIQNSPNVFDVINV